MIEAMRVVIKKSLQKPAGSLNISMPTSTVPTAPIPVHTAYAVPMGKLWVALIKRIMLTDKARRKAAYHRYIAFPVCSLAFPKQKAKATSNNPAIIKTIQFICSV
jgi:hypothetical protein